MTSLLESKTENCNLPDAEMAVAELSNYLGCDLAQLASEYGIEIYSNGNKNKGWRGQLLEALAGLPELDNRKAIDGADFELKSVSFACGADGLWTPRETLWVTVANEDDLLALDFWQSPVWHKLRSVVLCAVSWDGGRAGQAQQAQMARLLAVRHFKLKPEDMIAQIMAQDYHDLQQLVAREGICNVSAHHGRLLQLRPKGGAGEKIRRGWYGRKELVKIMMG